LRRQPGAAAPTAPSGRDHERSPRGLVDTLHQQPGAPVRHVHLPGRLADAVPAVDALQQLQSALAQDRSPAALDPDAQAHGPIAAPGTAVGGHGEVSLGSLWSCYTTRGLRPEEDCRDGNAVDSGTHGPTITMPRIAARTPPTP